MKYFHFISTNPNSLNEFNIHNWQNTTIQHHRNLEEFQIFLKAENNTLVFLDVDAYTKVEALERLDKLSKIGSRVIVVSKDKNFAYDAIKAGAYNYILKSNFIRDSHQVCAQYLSNVTTVDQPFYKITIHSNNTIHYLNPNEIIRCKADSNYTWIISKNKNILIAKTLQKVEKLLPENLFFRPHRSHIVNIRHINMVRNEKSGVIVTSDNHDVPISRNRKKSFLNKIHTYTMLGKSA